MRDGSQNVLMLMDSTNRTANHCANRPRRRTGFVLVAMTLSAVAGLSLAEPGHGSVPAIRAAVVERFELVGMTAPYREATLATVLPARISELPAEEGARVGRGDLVVRLDDTGPRCSAGP